MSVDEDADDPAALRGQLEVIAAENRRLREEVTRARQARYRRTALGLAVLGVIAGLGGLLFADVRDTLLTLAAIGLFAGLLVYYLTPDAVIPGEVGERVYDATARNLADLADQLGLDEETRYLPTEHGVSVYIPQETTAGEPDADAGPIVTEPDARGLLVASTGGALLSSLEDATRAPLADDPGELAMQLADAVVELFELARTVEPDVEAGRASFAISGSTFERVDGMDHPLASLLAAGMAAGLDRTVTLEVAPGGEYEEWLVTCRWSPD